MLPVKYLILPQIFEMKADLLIFINLIKLFSICDAQFQLTQKQAQQVASQLKSCVPVKPGENMDYFTALVGTWNVVKIYDAPVQQQHSIPPLSFIKNEQTGELSISGTVPGKYYSKS